MMIVVDLLMLLMMMMMMNLNLNVDQLELMMVDLMVNEDYDVRLRMNLMHIVVMEDVENYCFNLFIEIGFDLVKNKYIIGRKRGGISVKS